MPLASPFDVLSRALPLQYVRAPQRTHLRRNLLLRIIDAIGASNRRKAEREIARYIARNGGRLIDQLERDVALRLDGPR